MNTVVRDDFERVEILVGADQAMAGARALSFAGEAAALDELSRLALRAGALAAFREVLARAMESLDVSGLDDGDVLRQLAWFVAAGRVRLAVLPAEAAVGIAVDDAPSEADPELVSFQRRVWIAIRLVDDEQRPVPYEAYRIKLPSEGIVEGTLDGKGYARVDDIEPGVAQVCFPGIDAADWRPVGASGGPTA